MVQCRHASLPGTNVLALGLTSPGWHFPLPWNIHWTRSIWIGLALSVSWWTITGNLVMDHVSPAERRSSYSVTTMVLGGNGSGSGCTLRRGCGGVAEWDQLTNNKVERVAWMQCMHKYAIKKKHGCNKHDVECRGRGWMGGCGEFKFEKDIMEVIGKRVRDRKRWARTRSTNDRTCRIVVVVTQNCRLWVALMTD